LSPNENVEGSTLGEIFESFSKSYRRYWETYVVLQDQLYETLRAAREVQWLAATDERKLSEINSLQRELFASVPRRLDYAPLSQISQDLDSAPSKIEGLDAALSSEEDACKALESEIAILRTSALAIKKSLQGLQR
jgi:hypothetical protein